MNVSPEQKEELEALFARGLRMGLGGSLGSPLRDDDKTCIQGAISLVMHGTLSESPPCVSEVDREWAIEVNDASWETAAVRAKALLPIAFAQIGTAGSNRSDWVDRVVMGTVNRVMPIVLEKHGHLSDAKIFREAPTPYRAVVAVIALQKKWIPVFTTFLLIALTSEDIVDRADAIASCITTAAEAMRGPERCDGCNQVLQEAVDVALDAYRQEGRHV